MDTSYFCKMMVFFAAMGLVGLAAALRERLAIARKESVTMKGAKFAVGDVVRLKSGSPKMTVSEVYDDDSKYVDVTTWSEEHLG